MKLTDAEKQTLRTQSKNLCDALVSYCCVPAGDVTDAMVQRILSAFPVLPWKLRVSKSKYSKLWDLAVRDIRPYYMYAISHAHSEHMTVMQMHEFYWRAMLDLVEWICDSSDTHSVEFDYAKAHFCWLREDICHA